MNKATLLIASALNFYGPEAGWKVDGDGKVELRDGNPVYTDADGNERTIAVNTISTIIGENKQYRTRAQTAEQSLAAFEGLDAAAARDALEKIKKIDSKTLIDAGKVDEIRAEIENKYKGQLEELKATASKATSTMEGMMVDTAFSTSKFIGERVNLAPDIVRSLFGNNFKVENGNLIPHGPDGKPLYSNERVGEVASFDEAIKILIEGRPDKDNLLLANVGNGTGSKGGGGTGSGDGRVYRRSEFDAMHPGEQAQIAGLVREGKAKLID